MGLGGVDTNLVGVLPICQFCQFPAKTGKLTTGPPRSCLRPLDPYIDGKLSARRLRRLLYMGGALLQPELVGLKAKIGLGGHKATIFIYTIEIYPNMEV